MLGAEQNQFNRRIHSEVNSSIAGGRSTPGSDDEFDDKSPMFDDHESVSSRMNALDDLRKKPQGFFGDQ